jgi:hypothetical protein
VDDQDRPVPDGTPGSKSAEAVDVIVRAGTGAKERLLATRLTEQDRDSAGARIDVGCRTRGRQSGCIGGV